MARRDFDGLVLYDDVLIYVKELDRGYWEIVTLAMVNHRSVPKEWVASPGDRMAFFPKDYNIFADWVDHRF
jgi:hypothetical protein